MAADSLTRTQASLVRRSSTRVRGEVGNIEINPFEGPSQFVTDLAVSKKIRFGSRYNFQLRADIFNLFNTVNWNFGDIDINSTTAGRITGTGGARLVQFSAKFEF